MSMDGTGEVQTWTRVLWAAHQAGGPGWKVSGGAGGGESLRPSTGMLLWKHTREDWASEQRRKDGDKHESAHWSLTQAL